MSLYICQTLFLTYSAFTDIRPIRCYVPKIPHLSLLSPYLANVVGICIAPFTLQASFVFVHPFLLDFHVCVDIAVNNQNVRIRRLGLWMTL